MSSNIQTITTKNAPPPLPFYSQAVVANGLIFCSGQIPADPDGNVISGDVQAHTERCILNLKGVLEAAGSSLNGVVKVNILLADINDFAKVNETYAKYFTSKPARTCVSVKDLPKGVDIEIECIAVENASRPNM